MKLSQSLFRTLCSMPSIKRIITMIALCTFLQSNYSQFNETTELKPGVHFLYGDKVRMRSKPSLESSIIYTLPIATPVTVVQIMPVKTTIEGEEDYWYKVKYNEKEGYIWGSLIADNSYRYRLDEDSSQEQVLILNLTRDPNLGRKENNILKFKVIRHGNLISEFTESSYYGVHITDIQFINWKDFSVPLRLLDVSYEFNGEVGGSAELFLRFENDKLSSIFSYQHGYGEGGYSCENDAIFPHERNGKPDQIIVKQKCAEVSECDDTPQHPCKWEYREEIYTWNGSKFESK